MTEKIVKRGLHVLLMFLLIMLIITLYVTYNHYSLFKEIYSRDLVRNRNREVWFQDDPVLEEKIGGYFERNQEEIIAIVNDALSYAEEITNP